MSSDCTVTVTDSRVTPAHIQYENQQRMVQKHEWRCCLNCLRRSGEACSVNGFHIPPEVAVHGCSNYDDLPF